MTELRARAVEKRYGDLQILKGVDLDVEDGEFVVLVGPSGCGKTTLLNIIAGLDLANSGTIEIDGNVVNKVSPANRNIAMVFQSYALYPTMTVRKNITFGMECRGVARSDRETATNRVAELLQITHLLDRKPSQLSGGQRQRVAMGRALVREPSLFLFDEPLSNLDAKLRVEMRGEIKKLHAKMGTTSIYVTHDQVEAMTLASRIAIMNRGQIEQFCTPREMYDQPASLFVARFMGAPPMNTLQARVSNASGDLQVLIGEDPASQALSLAGAKESVRAWIDREIVIGIRPECISDASEGQSGLPGRSVLEAHVELTEPTGAETLVTLRIGKSEFLACVNPDIELASGQKASFAVDMRRACLFDPTTERRIA